MATSKLTSNGEQLFIVGLNVSPNKAYYEERKGALSKIVPGVYIDSSAPPAERREVLMKNAARIALRMYPRAILAGSSAFHRGPVDGHLMIATARGGSKAVDVGGAFRIYIGKTDLDLGMNREVEHVTIEDSFGPYPVPRVADEMLIIKNFLPVPGRPRQTYLSNPDLNRVVDRCMRRLGGHAPFMRRVEGLAIAHGMASYLKRINAFVDSVRSYEQEQHPLEAYQVYWHQARVATLTHDGHVWNFEYEPRVNLQLSVQEKKGRGAPPSFLASLLPESGVKPGTTMNEKLSHFRRAHRYMSNITVKSADAADKPIIIDMLDGELQNFTTDDWVFSGRAESTLSRVLEDDRELCVLERDPDLPRMSGMQIKLPGNLDRDGILRSGKDRAFTHIIKAVSANQPYSSMCSMEWFSLTIANNCGLVTEQFAIADLGGHGPSLIAERFDVRRDLNDRRMILTEDFWSIAGMQEDGQKYYGDLMTVADVICRVSTDKDDDGRRLLAQAVFSWLTFNGDMHLKNLLLLKHTRDPRNGFESVRLSPAYDLMCTKVFPNDSSTAAIALAGNRQHTLAGFRALGAKFGIKALEVDALVEYLALRIPTYAGAIAKALPAPIRQHTLSVTHIGRAVELFDVRCLAMLTELQAAKRTRGRKSAATAVEAFSADLGDAPAQAEHRRTGRRP